jgi:hypothetical protein
MIDWEEQVFHPGGSVRYRFSAHGKRVVYATDVELDLFCGGDNPTEEKEAAARDYLRFVHGVDLLIADGMFSEEEYPSRVGWGHASIPTVIEVAAKAEVKQLAVFHHDPQHSDKCLDDLCSKYRSRNLTDPKVDLFWAEVFLAVSRLLALISSLPSSSSLRPTAICGLTPPDFRRLVPERFSNLRAGLSISCQQDSPLLNRNAIFVLR